MRRPSPRREVDQNTVGEAEESRQLTVVVEELSQHVNRRQALVLGVSSTAGFVRCRRSSATLFRSLPDPLRDIVANADVLGPLPVEQQMIVAKVSAADVPVKDLSRF
jgi:hypothetical protein